MKKRTVKITCPACKKKRFLTVINAKGIRLSSLCIKCATTKKSVQRNGINVLKEIKNKGCILTEQAFIFTKKEDKTYRSGRCKKYIDCKNREECCDLVVKQNWQGWISDGKGFKRLSKSEKMAIYEVNEDHLNITGYLPNKNAHLYRK